jgi:pantoate--beta-alanine ligase
VAQVVSKLFDIVSPDRAYFGRKDFQQYSIILKMCQQLQLNTAIIPCEIVREADGLAMSSRNSLLTREHRAVAPRIYQILQEARLDSASFAPAEVVEKVVEKINSIGLLKAEYFDIVDEYTLESVNSWEEPGTKVGCIAVFAGAVRLIDNVIFDK